MKKSLSTYLISLGAVLLTSVYPIYMGVIMLTAYLRDGDVNATDYPKYIIPYTPVSIALIICVALLPLAVNPPRLKTAYYRRGFRRMYLRRTTYLRYGKNSESHAASRASYDISHIIFFNFTCCSWHACVNQGGSLCSQPPPVATGTPFATNGAWGELPGA
ncbi:MAG: hypothetical protein FWD23_14020 [Oscillospiraceae bacterium]|nr:hypothetical protein [Oscillospiraceae bacterium]